MTNRRQIRKLGELCQLISGQHIEAKHYNTECRGIGYLTGPSDFGPTSPVISKWTESPKVKAKSGDTLITVKGSGVGSINILDQDDIAISRQLMAVRTIGADARFIHAFLASKFDYLQSLATGAAIPGLSRDQILGLDVDIPPLPEQKRIIAILDEAFEGIDTAIANAEKNLTNARELFDSYLNSIVGDAWKSCALVSLSELATDITDGDHQPPPKADTGVPFITIGNILKETRKVDFTDTFKVSQEYFDGLKENRKPRNGDVLYTVTGSFGIPVIINKDYKFCFQRHIGLIRPKVETDSAWLYYLLLAPQVFAQASEGATGTAQKTVSLKVLRGFQVPRVPLSRQRSAVAELDALATSAARLENIYRQKLTNLAELKQAILQKAFAGELTEWSAEAMQEAAE